MAGMRSKYQTGLSVAIASIDMRSAMKQLTDGNGMAPLDCLVP
jgi:hypothetical protein